MLCKINSVSLFGISGIACNVEVDTSNGIPNIKIIGQISNTCKEISSRAIIAIKNSGFKYIPKKITVNISPVEIPKLGSSLDLAICIGIINNLGYISTFIGNHIFMIGEVGLDGGIHKVNGIVPMLLSAKKSGSKICFIPYENKYESNIIKDLTIICVKSLREVVNILNNKAFDSNNICDIRPCIDEDIINFNQIYSQSLASRVCLISAAGNHHLLMSGPKGIGKTMLANAMIGILPDLTNSELLEVNTIYSAYGMNIGSDIINGRPFRAPNSTITKSMLLGNFNRQIVGEITLAHKGILFIDEFNLLSSEAINCLRLPLENKLINTTYLKRSISYPADFLFIAAMNSCPCGEFPDLNKCKCSFNAIKKYREKINNPILDRIDLVINMNKVAERNKSDYDSVKMKNIVTKIRDIQLSRNEGKLNSELTLFQIQKYSKIDKHLIKKVHILFEDLHLSFRGYKRVLNIARTIADIDGSEVVKDSHIEESIFLERGRYW